jgi:hypothetical protein
VTTELPPGRPLDALVAEKVMDLGPVVWSADDLVLVGDPEGGVTIPRYSTDITAAWEVVTSMLWRDFTLHLEAGPDESAAGFVPPSSPNVLKTRNGGEESSRTPHVICLAALRAVGAA